MLLQNVAVTYQSLISLLRDMTLWQYYSRSVIHDTFDWLQNWWTRFWGAQTANTTVIHTHTHTRKYRSVDGYKFLRVHPVTRYFNLISSEVGQSARSSHHGKGWLNNPTVLESREWHYKPIYMPLVGVTFFVEPIEYFRAKLGSLSLSLHILLQNTNSQTYCTHYLTCYSGLYYLWSFDI